MLDDPTDMVGTALIYLGKDPNSESEADLKARRETLLMTIRPYIRTIHSSQYIDELANGELCIVVGYSGDVLQARDRAAEAGKPLDIGYSIPREGALDVVRHARDSRGRAEQGKRRIASSTTCCSPEVAAKNSNFVNYANANSAATALVNEELRADPASIRHPRSRRGCSRASPSPPSSRARSTARGRAS